MYSTSMINERYFVECLAVTDEVVIEKFIVDTGAKYTCCQYRVINKFLKEEYFRDKEIKYMGGLIRGEIVRFYKYSLKQFTIGNIDLGKQDIWITFDERVTDIILGMDILKRVITITNSYNQRMYFCKDAKDYYTNFVLSVNK